MRLDFIPKPDGYNSEPPAPHLEHLLGSLLKLYQKLKELGFTYYNGNVSVIDEKEVKDNV